MTTKGAYFDLITTNITPEQTTRQGDRQGGYAVGLLSGSQLCPY
jgi:hypothetical protein